ncbi:YebO family protein [Kalamiella sp. sgz302252]|uniref:YebO family protein n=1 Tax=Pantoea sp. sgz302252 TaxID=3341827 RepID=UPI0036D383F1
MNELAGSAAGAALLALAIVIGSIVWFIVNRASVRANEQIRLLEALLEEQKRQNQLLKQLAEAQAGPAQINEESNNDFIRLIPER